MMIYFADRGMNVIGQAGSKLPQGMVIVDDLKVEEVDTGVASFECTIPFSPPMRGWAERCAQCGNYILRDNDGGSELYTIIESELDTKKGELTVYAEDAGLDLLNEIAMAFEAMEAYPIAWYIEKFSYDTGFEIGINEAADLSRKLKWDGESTLAERLTSVATQFGCELSYSFTTDGMKLTHKYINIYRERGEDNGVSLRLNKEIDRIVTSRTIENLATALYATGGVPEGEENNITLRGYSYDDGDIFLENGYLKSREAVKKWSRYLNPSEPYQDYTGHILRTYTYDTVDQQTLCSHAITALKKARDVDVNYEIDITDLPEHVRIGDRVNIVDDAGELYVSSRILKLETSITNNTKKATLGEYLIKTSGISDKVTALASDFVAAIKRVQKVEKDVENIGDIKSAKFYTRYSAYFDGRDMTVEPTDETLYMGTCSVNADTAPTDPLAYTWVRVKGDTGANGLPVTIESVTVQYKVTDDFAQPTEGWQSTVPSALPGQYLWMKTTVEYSDGTDSIAYSYTYQGEKGDTGEQGPKGDKGEQGPPGSNGADGSSVTVTNTEVKYGQSSSPANMPVSWVDSPPTVGESMLLWTRTTVYFSDGTSFNMYAYTKQGSKGDKGDTGSPGEKGQNGVSVTTMRRYYRLQLATDTPPAKPTTYNPSVPPTGWSETEPNVPESGAYNLYTVDLTAFSDGTFAYSDISLSSSYAAAKAAYEEASTARSEIVQLADKISLSVETKNGKASIVIGTDGSGKAGTIDLTGMVTFSNLKTSGQTVINADNISTGIINGAAFWSENKDSLGNVTGAVGMDGGGIWFFNGGNFDVDVSRARLRIENDTLNFTSGEIMSDLLIDFGGSVSINGSPIKLNGAEPFTKSSIIPIANGGTGRSTLTSGYFLRGNGTSAVTMSSAASARSAMGLGDSTGALGIANGGTGATTKNAAANNLCEVGTWTPRLTNVEGSAPTYTTGWNYGSYLKIGTLVWVWCDMALGISNIGGNYAGVSGLPYANDGSCGLHLVEAYNVLALGGNGNIYPNTSVIGNMVRFRTPTGADSYNWQTNTSLGTNVGRLRFSGIYRTT